LCQHCSKNNYLGILTLIKQRLKRFASFSADGNNCSPLNEREGGGGGVLLYINIDHLSLQLSARQLIRLLGFSTISCLLSSSQVKRSSNWEYCLQGGFHVTSHPASFLFLHQKNVSFSSQEWVCHSRLCLLTREGSKTLGHWGTTRTTL